MSLRRRRGGAGDFYYDHDAGARAHDPWLVLAAIALRTERIRLGLVLVPLSWRAPWLVARAATTLDHLSNGRVILPVGLGAVEPARTGSGGQRRWGSRSTDASAPPAWTRAWR